MKETKLYVLRIFNFCTQNFSDVTGFTNKPCFTDRMISSQTQKIFGMDATIGHTLSRKPIGNRASYEYPWISLCLFLRSFVHMDTGLDNNNKDFLIVYLLLMWINAAMNCVNYWKFSCFMQLYCNIFTLTRYSHFYQNCQALNWIKSKPKSIEIKEISHHPL